MSALTDLKAILIYILAALVLVLGLSTWQYRRMFKATDFALTTQNAAIKQQNKTAEDLLRQRTEERDALQTRLNTRAAAQEKTDEKAVDQIAVDDKRQRVAPVRVRVHDCTRDAGPRGGGAPSGAPATAKAGAGDAGAASGVLPEVGARRLADALTEIETMSAAFSSCKGDSFQVRGLPVP
jgi:hypothetical protein